MPVLRAVCCLLPARPENLGCNWFAFYAADMTPESPTDSDLPVPYNRDPGGWAPRPPRAPRSVAPGPRLTEAQAAHVAIFGRGATVTDLWDAHPAGGTRRVLLLAAAAADAAALQSAHAPRYKRGLETRAHLIAQCLYDFDEEHGTGRGPIPVTDARWAIVPGDRETPRRYLRQELTALLDAEPVDLEHR